MFDTLKFASVLCLLCCCPAAQAERIYEFINYPHLQLAEFGNTPCCQGDLFADATITVVDTAIHDGRLEVEEVLGWSVTFASGLSLGSQPRFDWQTANITLVGVLINRESILLPGDLNEFGLRNLAPEDVGSGGNSLIYMRAPNLNTYQGGEQSISGWEALPADDALGGDPWVIARSVPEPDTTGLLLPSLLLLLAASRSARESSGL